VPPVRVPYNPRRLYVRLGRYFAWASPEVLDRMHYPRFFGFLEEVNAMLAEERAGRDEAEIQRLAQQQIQEVQFAQSLQPVQTWDAHGRGRR